MMDSVGHYARPELLSLHIDDRPSATVTRWSDTHGTPPAAAEPSLDDRAAVLRVAAG
jgi:nitrilase